MARTSASNKADTFTFRLSAGMKSALARSAADEDLRPAELVRNLVVEHLEQRARRRFEDEARRQCLVINAATRTPDGDEARVLRELEGELESFADEWR